jgi:hypothetical protein
MFYLQKKVMQILTYTTERVSVGPNYVLRDSAAEIWNEIRDINSGLQTWTNGHPKVVIHEIIISIQRILLEKPTVTQLVNELPAYRVHKNMILNNILSQMNALLKTIIFKLVRSPTSLQPLRLGNLF